MRKQILSFKCALRGLSNTIKSESHMRFHMVAGFYVLLFSLFYDFTPAQIALLVVLIASVMVAEVFNTSIEEICNLTADHYEPLVKTAKDAAAGAVFLISVASVVVAVMFFWDCLPSQSFWSGGSFPTTSMLPEGPRKWRQSKG